jgi:hypothetical protein
LNMLPIDTLCRPMILISLTRNSSNADRLMVRKIPKKKSLNDFNLDIPSYKNLETSLNIAKIINAPINNAPTE